MAGSAPLATPMPRPIAAGAPAPRGRSITLRFGVTMVLFGAALAGLYSSPALHGLLAPLDPLTAAATAGLIDWTGLEVHRQGAVLSHPGGFSYEIYYRCTGWIVAAFLAAGLIALPGGGRAKAWGMAIGAALVMALNTVRLVALFWVGVRLPAAFDFAHGVMGEAGMLLAVLVFWVAWLRRTESRGGAGIHRRRIPHQPTNL